MFYKQPQQQASALLFGCVTSPKRYLEGLKSAATSWRLIEATISQTLPFVEWISQSNIGSFNHPRAIFFTLHDLLLQFTQLYLYERVLEIRVILYLTGLNYYGLLKSFFNLTSMCMCSQCDSTSLPVQRSQIKLF